VELFNAGDVAVCLQGWRLESGNGAGPGRWTLEWEGTAADTVGPRSFFVIGEELVEPEPQAVADLDLQNGPDACRLLAPAGAADLVGWGDHAYGEYYEGRPSAEAGAGVSLGRDPDGTDSDDNAADFSGLEPPSPAGFNRPPCDLELVRAGRSRYTPAGAAQLDIVCLIRNLGSDSCGARTELTVSLAGLVSSSLLPEAPSPGDDARAVVRVPGPGEGLHPATVWVDCEADPRSANDSICLSVLVPPPPLVVNELMARPLGSDCEWVEILNRSSAALSIKEWTIEDSAGKPREITGDDLRIEPGAFVVVVESEEDFRSAYPGFGAGSQAVALRPAGGWPTLNDVQGTDGFADRLVLRDRYGTAVDSVAYGAGWVAAGASLERIDPAAGAEAFNWSPHSGAGGSPGRRNAVSALVPGGAGWLNLAPTVFSPDGDGDRDLVAASIRVERPGTVRLSVYDINGRLVRRLVDGGRVEATRVAFWDGLADDGSPAPRGVYVVLLEGGFPAGEPIRAKAAVVLVRR